MVNNLKNYEKPTELLSKTFEEVQGYNDWVVLDSIRVELLNIILLQ